MAWARLKSETGKHVWFLQPLLKVIIEWQPGGKRRRDRPENSWQDMVEEDQTKFEDNAMEGKKRQMIEKHGVT